VTGAAARRSTDRCGGSRPPAPWRRAVRRRSVRRVRVVRRGSPLLCRPEVTVTVCSCSRLPRRRPPRPCRCDGSASLGYWVSGWRVGRSLGPTDGSSTVLERFERLSANGADQPRCGASAASTRGCSPVSRCRAPGHHAREPDRPHRAQAAPIPVPNRPHLRPGGRHCGWDRHGLAPGASRIHQEVTGSRCGLGHSPSVLRIIAERLAARRRVGAPRHSQM
jgi:hypothetical protein